MHVDQEVGNREVSNIESHPFSHEANLRRKGSLATAIVVDIELALISCHHENNKIFPNAPSNGARWLARITHNRAIRKSSDQNY